jgi:hypothetical protein
MSGDATRIGGSALLSFALIQQRLVSTPDFMFARARSRPEQQPSPGDYSEM